MEHLTIIAGEKTGTITITDIIDDTLDEENETVIVTLSNPNNAILGTDNTLIPLMIMITLLQLILIL